MEYRLLTAPCLILFVVFPLQAAVYQWTDEEGQVHFSDRPTHESATEKTIHTSPANPSNHSIPENRQQKRQRMLEVYEQERMEKREAAAKKKQEREERKRQCINAKIEYENYSNAGVIYEYHEDGNHKYLDQQEREQYLAKLKAKVDSYCR